MLARQKTSWAGARYRSPIRRALAKMKTVQNIKSGFLYALIVFLVGFCLGTIRVLFVVPKLGVRWAEILEAPLMILVSYLAARFLSNLRGSFSRWQGFIIGLVALAFMAAAEISFVVVQGLSLTDYVAAKDPVSGSIYLISLGIFALMPLIVSVGTPQSGAT